MAEKRGRGHPRKFSSGDELIELWMEFCAEIVANGYLIAPTKTEFEKWLFDGEDRKCANVRTVYLSLKEYYPNVKSEFDRIRADVVAQGTMLGKYQPSMSIFALKNWCGWTDKSDVKQDNTIRVLIDGDGYGD